jgi:hypothetical protein
MTVMQAPGDIAEMNAAMDEIIKLLEQETTLVRAGKLGDAARLETEKAALSQRYYLCVNRLKAALPQLKQTSSDALQRLQRKHDEFRALLQMNLTVLATAHAVSEGIMRGVSDELARKAAPSTYGATGRANAPGPGAAQPLAVSRVL